MKRALDLVLASVALVVLAPVFVLVAVAIVIEDGGPVFFVQDRVGRGNHLFQIYKFRSMHVSSLDRHGDRSTDRGDARITRVGRIIRATSIDETPQLLNILLGTMTFVGPRPHALGSTAGGRLPVVVPNFVALPPATTSARQPTIFYLGRIHPKKNLDALIDGWRRLTREERRGHRLTIAGWGDAAHIARLEARLAERPDDDIAFVGPVFGEAKEALIGQASFVVLASHSEGLPVAILESWAAGTPTLMSRHCHLDVGFARGAAIDCDTSAAGVAAALRTALALEPGRWNAMSRAARTLVEERFSRHVVLAEWRAIYARLLVPIAGPAAEPVAGAETVS